MGDQTLRPTSLVLFSGGLDSTVCLSMAMTSSESVLAVLFDYGQVNRREIDRAHAITAELGVELLVVELDLSRWGGSSLLAGGGVSPIRSTVYVPARNLVFLSIATSIAEARDIDIVYLGANASEQTFRDARREFLDAFRAAADEGTRRGGDGRPIVFRAPLAALAKEQVVRTGIAYGAPLHLTWSCYLDEPFPCGECLACLQRSDAFAAAALPDPALDHLRAERNAAQAAEPAEMVYLLGAPHSGSTLLSLLLDTHPNLFAAGELADLAIDDEEGVPCTCGLPVPACGFWTSVKARTGGFALSRASSLERDVDAYRSHSRSVIAAAAEAAGVSVLLDSSKSAERFEALESSIGPRVIHLVRDGRAHLDSRGRRGLPNDPVETAHRWLALHDRADAIRERLGERAILVRYEDICADPAGQRDRILRWLGLDPAAASDDWTTVESHHVRGNLNRFARGEIVLDEDWTHRLEPEAAEQFTTTARAGLQRYGYLELGALR